MQFFSKRTAFTLIELLVVIAIIGILSGLIIVGMNSSVQSATIAKAQIFSSSLRDSLLMNLVSDWKLDEGSGATTVDAWGGGNNCTLADTTGGCDATHCPQWQSTGCVYGKCLSFNAVGTSQTHYVNCGNNANINSISGALTVEGWVYPRASSSYSYLLSNDRDCCGVYNGYSIRILSGVPYFNIWNSSAHSVPSSTSQSLNNWNYIVGTFDGTTMKIYLNGQQTGSLAYSGTIGIPASYNLRIGAMGYSAALSINGIIDSVRVYSTAMPSSKIKEQYYAGIKNLLMTGSITNSEFQQRLSKLDNNFAKE